jgi:hypothetical protein
MSDITAFHDDTFWDGDGGRRLNLVRSVSSVFAQGV